MSATVAEAVCLDSSTAALVALFVVAGLAVLLVVPAFALLYFLQQRHMLTAAESEADLRLAAQLGHARRSQPAPGASNVRKLANS